MAHSVMHLPISRNQFRRPLTDNVHSTSDLGSASFTGHLCERIDTTNCQPIRS